MKQFIYVLGWCLISANCFADVIEAEEVFLEETRDRQINQCTSIECRDNARSEYEIQVLRLRNDPDRYFAMKERRGAEEEEEVDLNEDPHIKQRCKKRWGSDYRMVEFCIEEQLKAKHRLGK